MAARRPEEVDQLFVQAFSAGDLETLVALYEPDAALVPQSGQLAGCGEGDGSCSCTKD
jgi:ketosteroid isomerase-like protein